MYDRSYWVDHVEDQHGEVIQEGTPMDQAHFNNAEQGISANGLALALIHFKQTQDAFNNEDELHAVTLQQNNAPWPFNNKETTIALDNLRENTNYSVEVGVIHYSGGRLGNIRVLDRARNGFKLIHDGSATEVQVSVRVSGGMTDKEIPAVITTALYEEAM